MFAANSCSSPDAERARGKGASTTSGVLHESPDARDDDPATIRGHTKTYIRDFDRSLSESHRAVEACGVERRLTGPGQAPLWWRIGWCCARRGRDVAGLAGC